MKILALEFSSPQRSVAVISSRARPSDTAVSEVVETGGSATKALTMVEAALRAAKIEREEIDCLAVATGPGSYTGLRAAISLAQGWQLACGTKLLGISSAECVVAQAQAEDLRGAISVVIDAQRGEFYLARYEITSAASRETAPLRLATLDEVREWERAGDLLVGPEVTRWFPKGRLVFPRAAMLARLAVGRNDFVSAASLQPVYLRETTFVKAPLARIFPDGSRG